MKIHMVSLGCARNQVDSEGMLGRLNNSGWEITDDPETAEVIVINTCSFIESAAQESIDTILEMAEYKEYGNCRRLVVAGCLPERYREEIVSTLPEVDIFLGTGAYDRILDAVENSLTRGKCLLPDPDLIRPHEQQSRVNSSPFVAYLKVAEGCDKKCTYCVIPKLRGHLKSRRPQDILAEAGVLIKNRGMKELNLVAQDTTNYGKDLTPPAAFDTLLASLAEMTAQTASFETGENTWIRFLYGHPESITTATIETIARFDNLCPYFDIPIQHASNPILKKMGRNYTREDLVALFDRIRSLIPHAVLRTTVIVGFPGESEDDFQTLSAFIERVEFNHLGAFLYSDGEDLPSHHLPNHVGKSVAQKRLDRLMTAQADISLRINQTYIGKTYTVLVEEQAEDNLYIGRTAFQAPEVDGITYIKSKALSIGTFISVTITDALEYDLIGEVK